MHVVSLYFSFHTDNENPIISNMPTNITVDTDIGMPTAVVTWTEPTATDNSGIQTLTATHSPGSAFNIGVTLVTYTSVDAAGHQSTLSFSVKVKGNELNDMKTKF